MKKLILAILIGASITSFAQERPLISTAIIALNKGDLPEAKKHIDEAGEIIDGKGAAGVDEKQMSKYLYHKGVIYYRISVNSDENVKALAPDGLDVATEYLIKLLDYETQIGSDRYTKDAVGQVPYLIGALNNRAYAKYQEQNFTASATDYLTIYEIRKNPALGKMMAIDTSSLYYAGTNFISAKNFEKGTVILAEVLDMGYNGYTFEATNVENKQVVRFATKAQMDKNLASGKVVDGKRTASVRPDVYKTILSAYQQEEDTDNFNLFLAKARAEFPEDGDLILQQLQGHLTAEEYDEAMAIIDQGIAQNPDNYIFYYVQGYIYQNNIMDEEKALAGYAKALTLNPDDKIRFDCNFNSGQIWYTRGQKTIETMNSLGMSSADQKKYDALNVKKVEYFTNAIPYFEKAQELKPDDLMTIKALFTSYSQVKNYEKVKETKAILDGMESKQPKAE